MSTGLESRTVLVTGANSGIGLETVLELARRGFMTFGSVRSEEKAEAVVVAAKEAGVDVEPVVFDVTDADACAAAVERIRPYAVVNNAGYSNIGAIEDVSDDEARHQLETMVVAPMRLSRLALPHMRARRNGRIVNVSSIAGLTTIPLSGWYQACKHALEAASDALRLEVAAGGIAVSLVEPGAIRTAIWDDVARQIEARKGSAFDGSYGRSLSLTRLGQPFMGHPRQVAKVIAGAVAARRPKARYLVGYDAQALARVHQVTPTAVWDRVSRVLLGL
jgi:NAD(P)-dependent dehydrogenase (short-subunit alcohol dehydrogenase family)